jgi:hypothetical protein
VEVRRPESVANSGRKVKSLTRRREDAKKRRKEEKKKRRKEEKKKRRKEEKNLTATPKTDLGQAVAKCAKKRKRK